MKILFTSIHEPDPIIGGIERVTDSLINQFINDGLEVEVIVFVKHNSDRPYPVHYLPNPSPDSPENKEFYDNCINEFKPDIIINQCGSWRNYCDLFVTHHTTMISVMHNDPLYVYHSYASYLRNQGLHKYLPFLPYLKWRYKKEREKHTQWLVENNDKVVLLSRKHKNTFPCLSNKSVCVIPNPTDNFSDSKLPPAGKKKQIIFVGRLKCLEKAPQELIKAFAYVENKHPDWQLLIIGDGEDKEKLKSLSSHLKLNNIEFLGYKDSAPYYQDASVLCMTSVTEGFGMVLIEAMAHKCVPIAYNSFPSASEIIDNGVTGLLAKPRDHRDLAKKICYLIEHPQERFRMAEAAYKKAREKYHVDAIANQWRLLFNTLEKH